ncbi:MAG: hypothetical protein EOP48_30170, partial [Sphingobacteriales bacterium]
MGRGIETFKDPNSIPRQFICAICTDVVEKPVETPDGNLFCQIDIETWLMRSSKCPITRKPLRKENLKVPSNVVLSLISDLVVYCGNKTCGCNWTGPLGNLPSHLLTCSHKLPAVSLPINNLNYNLSSSAK